MKSDVNNAIGNTAIGGSAITGITGLVTQYYSEIMLLVAIVSLLVGSYHKHLATKRAARAEKRAEELHEIQLQRLKNEHKTDN